MFTSILFFQVMCVTTGETVLFPADRWFATDQDPYETTQTLYPLKGGKVLDASVQYKIDVYTSDIRYETSDTNVAKESSLRSGLGDLTVLTPRNHFDGVSSASEF
jgi:hypothetical protein